MASRRSEPRAREPWESTPPTPRLPTADQQLRADHRELARTAIRPSRHGRRGEREQKLKTIQLTRSDEVTP